MSSQEQTKAILSAVMAWLSSRRRRARLYPPAQLGIDGDGTVQVEGLPPLPSVFSPLRLREGADALARAAELAPGHGAGTLCWVGALRRAEAAVVLEPGMALGPARLAVLAAANALADALAPLAPPELPVRWRWPLTLTVNGGVVGALSWRAPAGVAEDAVPDWLAVGFELRLRWAEGTATGENPGETALEEEGFEDLSAEALTDGWARHLMANLDEWEARGHRRVTDRFLARLEDGQGEKRGIEPHTGALVIEQGGARQVRPL